VHINQIDAPHQRITQHNRFVPYGTHPNPSLSLRTSFMLGTNIAEACTTGNCSQETDEIHQDAGHGQ
jgi:hypothetical protein